MVEVGAEALEPSEVLVGGLVGAAVAGNKPSRSTAVVAMAT